MASALLTYLWVNEELQVDKFHKNHNRLYQVLHHMGNDDRMGTIETLPAPVAKALATEMPEVKQAAMAEIDDFNSEGFASVDEKQIKAKGRYVTDNFFHVFSFDLLRGNKKQPFPDKHSVLVSEKLAALLFQDIQGSIGKTFGWNMGDTTIPYKVADVFSNPPENSTAQFDILFSYEHKFNNLASVQMNGKAVLLLCTSFCKKVQMSKNSTEKSPILQRTAIRSGAFFFICSKI
jgi:hypothetical protein